MTFFQKREHHVSGRLKKSHSRELLEFFLMLGAVFLVRTFIFGLYYVPSGSMETTLLVGDAVFTDKLTPWFVPIQRGEVIAFNQPTYAYSKNSVVRLFQNYVGIFWGPDNWTKRVIALAGDRLEGKIEEGKTVLYLNGKKLEEPYVNTYPLAVLCRFNNHSEQAIGLSLGRYGKGKQDVQYDPRSWDPTKTAQQQPFYKENQDCVLHDAQGNIFLIHPGVSPEHLKSNNIFDIVVPEGHVFCMGDNRNGSFDSRSVGPIPVSSIHGRVKYRILSFYDANTSWMILSLLRSPSKFFSKFRFDRCFTKVV